MLSSYKPSATEQFEVDSALLSEIGEKLVTTPHVALAELVKNSYDADATEVHVRILPDERGMPTVAVQDNGHGMTRDAVHRYWMRIGTTNKSTDEVSPKFGRRRTGAKGIGRFACRRLGRVLQIDTCALLPKAARPPTGEKYERTTMTFHWDEFSPGSNVSTVKVQTTTERLFAGKTGLSLSMSKALDDEWSFRGYSYLKRQLAALCANQGTRRKGYQDDLGFRVFLTAPGIQGESEPDDLREQLIDAGWATLTARITSSGQATCELVAKGLGRRKILSSRKFTNLTDVQLRLAIFVIEKEWLRDKSVVSQGSIRDFCEEWGGVQVRYRGFRVYPYGDVEDDWLGIEMDRARRLAKPADDEVFNYALALDGVNASRAMLNMLSMKSYLGAVEVGPTQEGLDPKADRMGFVENSVLRELRGFVRFAIDWAMVLRDYVVQLDESKKLERLRRRLAVDHGRKMSPQGSTDDAIKTLKYAVQKISLHVPSKEKKDLDLLTDAAAYLESTLKLTTRDLSRLRLIASTATLTLLFAHEIKSLTSTFSSLAKSISTAAHSLTGSIRRHFQQLGDEVAESERGLSELLELTNSMGVLDRDARPIRLDLRDAALRAIKRFERVRTRYSITIDPSGIPEGLQVGPMLEGELLAILINVLSNSIKSVIAVGGQRQIALKAEKAGKHVRLDILDNGLGVAAEHFEEIFTPMISDPSGQLYDQLQSKLNPEDMLLLGGGTGLGLSIVRGILQTRHGNASLLTPSADWKFNLRLDLP